MGNSPSFSRPSFTTHPNLEAPKILGLQRSGKHKYRIVWEFFQVAFAVVHPFRQDFPIPKVRITAVPSLQHCWHLEQGREVSQESSNVTTRPEVTSWHLQRGGSLQPFQFQGELVIPDFSFPVSAQFVSKESKIRNVPFIPAQVLIALYAKIHILSHYSI